MKRGLVIGKFYPPHRGHQFLIESAASQVDHLDILVCWKEDQAISGALRAQWIHENHVDRKNLQLHMVWDFGDDKNSDAWAACTKDVLGYAPDVVFTSEDYGVRFAELLGATHVMVDRERRQYPVSGTAIRADPQRYWDQLSAPVRAFYAVRVAVVGAESTGTTTLARALAEQYKTSWIPEYGREYCEELVKRGETLEEHRWRTEEFVNIAMTQNGREDEAARHCNRILFCDTDALATSVWHERYLGYPSPEVRRLARPHNYVLYVLTDSDISFVQDGLRDGEHVRRWMTERFKQELTGTGVRWLLVRGSHQARVQGATQVIDTLVQHQL